MRVFCLLLPHFPISCETQRHPGLGNCPVVVTAASGSRRLVLDHSPELAGMRCGMPLQEALSRHGEIKTVPADTPYYWSIFNRILDSLEQKSPLVEGSDLGCAYLGIDGLEGIYRNDYALVDAVRKVMPVAFKAQMGVAEGKFLARLAAMYSPPGSYSVVSSDNGSAFLSDLPCDVLPLSHRSLKKLDDFGLRTLGQVAALPPGPLQSQFGPEGKKLWQLARGYDGTPIYPRQKEETVEASTTLPSTAVSLEAILLLAESLLSRAFARAEIKGRSVRRLTLWAQVWGHGYWEKDIRFKEPAINSRSAFSRLKHVMSTCPLPGPVEELGLKLSGLCQERGRQGSLLSEVRAGEQLAEDIRQMELRLGGTQVFRIREVEPWSRIPERRQALAPSSR